MRTFILKANIAKTTPDFSLDDLRTAGNMETVCQCIVNALFVAGALRKSSTIHVVLEGPRDPPKTISFSGASIKGLHAVELTIAREIKKALTRSRGMAINTEKRVGSGIIVMKKSFEQIIEEYACKSQLLYLHKTGKDIRDISFDEDITLVLGDRMGLSEKARSQLKKLNAIGVTLGPRTLFASQCITIAHNEMDRASKQ